jgi:glycerol-1-phosphate dehydrogenase [NAD(P)+]
VTPRAHVDPTDLEAVREAVGLDDPGSTLHPIGLREIVIAPNALDELDRMVEAYRTGGPPAVVVDSQPMRRGSEDLKPLVVERLRAIDVDTAVIRLGRDGADLHADRATIAEVVRAGVGAGCIVSVGSGTICDVAKEASRELDVPYLVVQTANSVNAFSDDMAVLLINGVKRTVPSRWPDALIVDLRVIADAPAELNRAGVGELASMFTAPADWRLAAAVGMDGTWDRGVVDLFRDGASELADAAPNATGHDVAAQRTLAELMTLSGLALGIAGRTSPISGTEHTVSHLLDMAAALAGRPTGLHGAQVGVAALAVAVAWRNVLESIDPDRLASSEPPAAGTMRQRIDTAFRELDPSGGIADECWSQYRVKLDRWQARHGALSGVAHEWPAIARELLDLAGEPAEVAAILRSAGAAVTFEELDPPVSRELAAWALFNGHLIRERFTLADLAWFTDAWSYDAAVAAIDKATAIARSERAQPAAGDGRR